MKPSIYEIKTSQIGSLFVMPKPSGEWLYDDIEHYKSLGVLHIISLLENEEINELGLLREPDACLSRGIKFSRLPIPDRSLPVFLPLKILAKETGAEIQKGISVAIHCRAGIGRAGLLACCVLIELGKDGNQALAAVSEARGVKVPDTEEQRRFILDYGSATD